MDVGEGACSYHQDSHHHPKENNPYNTPNTGDKPTYLREQRAGVPSLLILPLPFPTPSSSQPLVTLRLVHVGGCSRHGRQLLRRGDFRLFCSGGMDGGAHVNNYKNTHTHTSITQRSTTKQPSSNNNKAQRTSIAAPAADPANARASAAGVMVDNTPSPSCSPPPPLPPLPLPLAANEPDDASLRSWLLLASVLLPADRRRFCWLPDGVRARAEDEASRLRRWLLLQLVLLVGEGGRGAKAQEATRRAKSAGLVVVVVLLLVVAAPASVSVVVVGIAGDEDGARRMGGAAR